MLSSIDEELVESFKNGKQDAFDQLYEKYKKPILNYLYRFIGNLSNAEELSQEVFVKVYIHIDKYVPTGKFSSWVYRIASNTAKNFLRRKKYEKVFSLFKIYNNTEIETDFVDYIIDKKMSPDKIIQLKDIQNLIHRAIDRLPLYLKEAVILCDIEGFSYAEAAKIMNCRPMTVGSRLSRARKKLYNMLNYLNDCKL